jgi:hypothetical protein
MKLKIIYTKESERARLEFTNDRLDFYRNNGHALSLPRGVNVDNFKLDEAWQLVNKEFPSELVEKAKLFILNGWDKNNHVIMQYFHSLTYEIPKSISLVLTQYGGGGSYNVETCEVTINVNYNTDPLSILVHEITHILVDTKLVNKFNLTHEEKENLIKWLLTNDLELIKFIDVPKNSAVVQPPQSVLDELKARGYKPA